MAGAPNCSFRSQNHGSLKQSNPARGLAERGCECFRGLQISSDSIFVLICQPRAFELEKAVGPSKKSQSYSPRCGVRDHPPSQAPKPGAQTSEAPAGRKPSGTPVDQIVDTALSR